MRGKRAELPGKDILFGQDPPEGQETQPEVAEAEAAGPEVEVMPVAPAEPEAGVARPDPPAEAPSLPRSRGRGDRSAPPRSSRGEARSSPAPARERSRKAPGGGEAVPSPTPHIQLCAWIDPAINDAIDRLRARFLIDYGAKVTKSEIVEAVLREALADEQYIERLVL